MTKRGIDMHKNRIFIFPSGDAADQFLEDLRSNGFTFAGSAIAADPDGDGVLLAIRDLVEVQR
jgi:hypothetical protein